MKLIVSVIFMAFLLIGCAHHSLTTLEGWSIHLKDRLKRSTLSATTKYINERTEIEVNFNPEFAELAFMWPWFNDHEEQIPLSKKEHKESLKVLAKAMGKYPARLLADHVRKIYVVKSLRQYGIHIGGTITERKLYLVKTSRPSFLEEAFHHEFAHLLMHNYKEKFNDLEWKNINPEGFQYRRGELDFRDFGPYRYLEPYHLKGGFISTYAALSLNEDFAAMTQALFTPKESFWEVVNSHERVRKKLNLIIKFYHALDPTFTEDYFRKLAGTPQTDSQREK